MGREMRVIRLKNAEENGKRRLFSWEMQRENSLEECELKEKLQQHVFCVGPTQDDDDKEFTYDDKDLQRIRIHLAIATRRGDRRSGTVVVGGLKGGERVAGEGILIIRWESIRRSRGRIGGIGRGNEVNLDGCEGLGDGFHMLSKGSKSIAIVGHRLVDGVALRQMSAGYDTKLMQRNVQTKENKRRRHQKFTFIARYRERQ
ncbi:hypothetical protein L484_001221 [Morus notabilis]|uniref:Uncharacterized protein n=1 Tax=Morus notabilis TaxID=981085 RepID=W9T1R3_9ROSA|nr:hypothetical protein L484_001221 [Morus notabilis]